MFNTFWGKRSLAFRRDRLQRISGFLAIIVVFFIIRPVQVNAAISVVNTASANTGSGTTTSLTIPSFTVSGSNTMLLLGVTNRGNSLVSSATYGTSSFTSIGSASNGTVVRTEILRLMNPPAGTADINITLNGARRFVAGAILLTGVDQTDPIGTYNTATGTSTAPSVTVSSAANELVVDVLGNRYSTSASVGSGQTLRWTNVTTNGTDSRNIRGSSSTEAGASSVTMSWTLGSSCEWAIVAVPVRPALNKFNYRKKITIDRTKVGVTGTTTTTLSNYPMLISISDSDLATVGYGGHVENPNGYDILFRGVDDGVCGGAGTNPCVLSYQLEAYNLQTGALTAWVKLPSLNTNAATSDTYFYLYFGNSDITSSMQETTAVWDSNFQAVWHMSDNAANSTVTESTSVTNPDNGVLYSGTSQINTSTRTTTGRISGALSFNGSSNYIAQSATTAIGNPQGYTVSAWIRTGTASGHKVIGLENSRTGTGSTQYDRHIYIGSDGKAYAGCYNGAVFTAASTNSLTDSNWHHVTALLNDSTYIRIYVDGTLNNSTSLNGGGCENYSGYWRMGSNKLSLWTNGSDGYYTGDIDETRISNSIRSADWIKTDYNNQSSPSTFYSVGALETSPITLIQLVSFTAVNYSGLVQLQWKTGYEIDNLGFRLYRERKGKLIRITPSMIAGSALSARYDTALTSGRTYVWQDIVGNSPEPLRYWLEDVDTHGKSTWHGPATAAAGGSVLPQQVRSMVLSSLGKGASKTQSNTSSRRYSNNKINKTSYSASSTFTQGSFSEDGETDDVRLSAFSPFFETPKSFAADLRWRRAVKILVNKEGWYRVSQPQLVQAGLSSFADPTRLQLFSEGDEQPIFVSTRVNYKAPTATRVIPSKRQNAFDWRTGAGERLRFGENDWIEFYGTGLNTPWSETRVYWLVEGDQAGKRITATRGTSILSSTTSLPATIELNPKTIYWAGLRNGDRDNFFGSVVSSEGDDEFFQLNHLDELATAGGRLEIGLQGVSVINHSVQVSVNGVNIGSRAFAGQTLTSASFNLPWGLLLSGQNYISLTAQNGEEDISLVDFIRVTYWRVLDADEDTLSIEAEANQAVILGGFSSPGIRVMDVTDPLAVREIMGIPSQQSNGFSITVLVPGPGTRKLLAFTNSQVQSPTDIEPYQRSNWSSMKSGADVIIISHPDFMQSMQPLKVQQEAEGYTVALVNVNDLYDEFGYGEKTPYALKAFIDNALHNWNRKPRFLILVGDASFDPNNYLGLGDFDYVPTKLVDTDQFETASDDWFADSNNDGIPEIAVGRISGRTADEISAQVAKIAAYRQGNGGTQSWAKNVVLVADINSGFDFETASDRLSDQTPSSMSVNKIYRSQMDDATARYLILQNLNTGALLMNYLGHGSVDLWRGDLLTSGDSSQLTNGTRLPLVIAMNCLNGFFADIYTESLAEALMKAPNGGAVAVWASSGLSDVQGQQVMNEALFRQLFNYNQTVGEAVMKAKAAVSDQNVRKTWIFFGDPTIRLTF